MALAAADITLETLKQSLLTLNYRLTLRASNAWRGIAPSASEHSLYDGFQEILDADVVKSILDMDLPPPERNRIFHTLLGHYLQYRALPFENELSMWTRGAAAEVEGEKIYFKDIITWCQKGSDVRRRRIMEKETVSLSKFLKPFALSPWEFILEVLEEEFGYSSYTDFCAGKKDIDYAGYIPSLEGLLNETQELYFESMENWIQKDLHVPLSEANRFDGIYLLGMGKLNALFPVRPALADHLRFFDRWGMAPEGLPGIQLDIEQSSRKGSQAMTFALRIPQEIHLVMNPQGGWIDVETLFHEMGHALSNAFTSPELSPVDKDFHPSNTLSETYAFLLQNMIFTPVFLERQLKMRSSDIDAIIYYKTLKDMSFFRRYAAKFLAEYEMFVSGNIANGARYADLLKRHTGFSYRPESHLFDLVPELYSLDYVISWMAEATLEKTLRDALGENWMFKPETGYILKAWWRSGNQYELKDFFRIHGLGAVSSQDILNRWKRRLSRIP